MMVVRFPVIWSLLFVWVMSLSVNAQYATPDVETPFLPDDLEVITVENAGRMEELMVLETDVSMLSWATNSNRLATARTGASEAGVWIYDFDDRNVEVVTKIYHDGLNDIALSPSGDLLAIAYGSYWSEYNLFPVADAARGIEIWDLGAQREQTFIRDSEVITTMAFSNDGAHLVTGSQCGIVALWEIATASQKGLLQFYSDCHQYVSDLEFSADGNFVLGGGYEYIINQDRNRVQWGEIWV